MKNQFAKDEKRIAEHFFRSQTERKLNSDRMNSFLSLCRLLGEPLDASEWGTDQIAVKIQHKDRLLTDPGAIEDVLAVENDVVPFDRADVLEQGCITAFLGDSPRSPRPRDLLGLPIGFETERSWPDVDKNRRINRRYMTRQ